MSLSRLSIAALSCVRSGLIAHSAAQVWSASPVYEEELYKLALTCHFALDDMFHSIEAWSDNVSHSLRFGP